MLSAAASAFERLIQLEQITPNNPLNPLIVRVDLQEASQIDAPSLLYLASRIRRIGRNKNVFVSGTYPHAATALETLLSARFDRFVSGRSTSRQQAATVALIFSERKRDLTRLDPIHPKTIQKFLVNHCENLPQEEQDMVYLAVHECLENVLLHAYDKAARESGNSAGWFAVGLLDHASAKACLAILDSGIGIPETLRPQVSNWDQVFRSAGDYLREATTGQLTRSGQQKHGKGLRTLREWVSRAPGRALHVFSGGARISWGQSSAPELSTVPPFQGTIVCIELPIPGQRRIPRP